MEEHRKVAADRRTVERLRREAELLTAARHPGVVEFLRLDHEGPNLALVTARVDGQPLSAFASLPPEELAGLGAALATTLDDLHELGLVHGSVSADHVIVRVDGRPVLCGFGSGGRAGELVPDRSSPLEAGSDLEGLGRILRHFAVGPDARVLREMARSAIESAGSGRLSARGLAADLGSVFAGARLPTKPVPGTDLVGDRLHLMPRPHVRRRRPLAARAAVASVLMLAAVVGIAYWTGTTSDGIHEAREPEAAPLPSSASPSSTTVSTASTVLRGSGPLHGGPRSKEGDGSVPRTTSSLAARDCPRAAGVLTADVDDDGCDEVLTFEEGVLTAGARRWQLGRAGDIAVTGDWTCTGRRNVTLLRPSSGEVFRFDGWAAAGNDVVGDRLGRVDGARAARAADLNGDGCHELVVERFDGTTAVLQPGTPTS